MSLAEKSYDRLTDEEEPSKTLPREFVSNDSIAISKRLDSSSENTSSSSLASGDNIISEEDLQAAHISHEKSFPRPSRDVAQKMVDGSLFSIPEGSQKDEDVLSQSSVSGSYDQLKRQDSRDSLPNYSLQISIAELQFNMDDEDVMKLLRQTHTKQVFASFSFMSYPAEDLETHSAKLTNSGFLRFSYSKGRP
jgi:hypothetical protein